MAWIALEGMRFHAFHGVYPAEQTLGTDFIVDLYVQTKMATEDQVENTINYETIYQICQLEMDKPRKLVETVVGSIFDRMKHQFSNMQALRVRVRKLHPPLGGQVDWASVEESEDFLKECPRCKKKFISYDENCWERFPNLHTATRETLARQFGPRCLCDDCLKFYAG